MGIARGPNIITEGLVFGYDTGYGIASNNTATRFYPGQPSVNLFGDISNANARPNRTEYNTSAWTANFPKPPEDVGRVYSHTSGSLNSTWSGNSYGYTLISYSYLANTTYTLSCWVYVSEGANLTSLGTSMEGTTLTHTSNRYYDLNNKGTWQQISLRCNSSSAVNGNAIIAYPSRNGVTDGSHTGFWAIGGAKLEISDQVTPYVLGTRSDTASLIDLKRTTSIDVSNVSFDSTGQPTFDGTDDYINLDSHASIIPVGGPITIESIVRWDDLTPNGVIVSYGGNQSGAGFLLQNEFSAGLEFVLFDGNGNSGRAKILTANSTQYLDKYIHMVGTYDGSTILLYINGVQAATASYTNRYPSQSYFRIGNEYNRSYFANIDLSVLKIYNKVLTATEVKQNYNAYKNRFNI